MEASPSAASVGAPAESTLLGPRMYDAKRLAQGRKREPKKVLHMPGIPTAVRIYEFWWWHWWAVALLLFLPIFLAIQNSLYYLEEYRFSPHHPVNLDIRVAGCDVIVENTGLGYSFARLSYWKPLGNANFTKGDDWAVVYATMSSKISSFRCRLRVGLKPEHHGLLFKNVSIHVEETYQAAHIPPPSNIEEMVVVQVADLVANGTVKVMVNTAGHSRIQGVVAERLLVGTAGGKMFVGDSPHSGALAKTVEIHDLAGGGYLEMDVQNSDLNIHLDPVSEKTATLVGVKGGTSKTGEGSYHLAAGAAPKRSKIDVQVSAAHSATYFLAADKHYLRNPKSAKDLFHTFHGSSMEEPGLLKDGRDRFAKVAKWLGDNKDRKFIIFMNLVGPGKPAGMMRLLSTTAYKAFSASFFAMLSAGMLTPEIHRVETPIIGMHKFPVREIDGTPTAEENLKWVEKVGEILRDSVDLKTLGLPNARWVWSPVGSASYMFDSSQHRGVEEWSLRQLSYNDNWGIYTAAILTVVVGFGAGSAICYALYMYAGPNIQRTIRAMDMEATASYRLSHAEVLTDWVLSSVFVTWPVPGLLLRWATRPLAPSFTSYTLHARGWPNPTDDVIKLEKVDPGRVPLHPDIPGQNCFLFASQPQASTVVPQYANMLDQELHGTAVLRTDGKSLVPGKVTQIRIIAFQAGDKVLEKSAWSRPTMVRSGRAFTEFPFLLWKAYFGVLPADTFQYFLDLHCKPLSKTHSMHLVLSCIKLAVVQDAVLFAGEDLAYGHEADAAAAGVRIVASTGGDQQAATDDMYEDTHPAPLKPPSKRKPEDIVDFATAVPKATHVGGKGTGLSKKQFLVLDYGDQHLKLDIGADLDQIIRLEAVVETVAGAKDDHAVFEVTWNDLLAMVTGNKGNLTDHIILRDGLSPVAVLQAIGSFKNGHFAEKPLPMASFAEFPQIFKTIFPGQIFQWGQVLTLSWNVEEDMEDQKFNIQIVSDGVTDHGVPRELWTTLRTREAKICENVSLASGKALFAVAPNQPIFVQHMKCRLEVPHPDPRKHYLKYAQSAEFLIERPVTMQNLELAYAAFCIRNNIPQMAVPREVMVGHGVNVQEREFFLVKGYRAPIPTPREFDWLAWATKSAKRDADLVVENDTSDFITDGLPLLLRDLDHNEDVISRQEHHWYDGCLRFFKKSPAPPAKKPELERPLLEGAAPEAKAEAPEKKEPAAPTQILPMRTYMDVPTNTFWKYNAIWNEHMLLHYSMMPSAAQIGYIPLQLEDAGLHVLAKWAGSAHKLMQASLRIVLFWIQFAALCLPAMVVFGFTVYYDYEYSKLNSELLPAHHSSEVYLDDFSMQPLWLDRWRYVNFEGRFVYIFSILYVVIVIAATFYCNFLHSYSTHPGFFNFINTVVTTLSFATVYVVIFYSTMVVLWVIIGAMIDPNLIPIAIGIIGVLVIVKTQWANLKAMKDHAQTIIARWMDLVLHAIMEVFAGPDADDAWMSVADQTVISGQIVALMQAAEKDTTQKLYGASKIKTTVGMDVVGMMDIRRGSAAFQEGIGPADQQLVTDFVPKDVLPLAQQVANDEATINGTRAAPDQLGNQPDNELTETAISEALAKQAESFIPKKGQLTVGEESQIDQLAQDLKLRPETAKVVANAFHLSIAKAGAQEDAVLHSPPAMAGILTDIRTRQLFIHFVLREEGEGKDKKKVSTMQKYLLELTHKEMEGFYPVCAAALTKMVDWLAIGRTCKSFANVELLKVITTKVVDNELNRCLAGSAAFQLAIQLYGLAYKKWDSTYVKDPLQIFVDAGIVAEAYRKEPACQSIIQGAVDAKKAFDGSLAPEGLVDAILLLLLPSSRSGEDAGDIPAPFFLWFEALKTMLTGLGWTKEEMDEDWLRVRWDQVTEGVGLYRYRDLDEVNQLISIMANEGLWKAATKCLMLRTNLLGYASCDSLGLGATEAAKRAHFLHDVADKSDLKWISANLDWPVVNEEVWDKHVEETKFHVGKDPKVRERLGEVKAKAPKFLPVFRLSDFLADCLYAPSDAKVAQEVANSAPPLNAYPANVLDLQWLLGENGTIWHKLPGRARPLRGIWLECFVEMLNTIDCLPTDLDVFYQCVDWQINTKKFKERYLRLDYVKQWLEEEYLPKNLDACTFPEFKALLQDMLNVQIPDDKLLNEIFAKCPLVPDNDLGDLRFLSDLGAGLRMWMGYGLWQNAVAQLVTLILPRGSIRDRALAALPSEFAKIDTNGKGVVQPAAALVLVHKVAHPGLTCDDLAKTLKEDLNLDIPPRQLHKYYTMMDVNCDNAMQVSEFVTMMRLIMTDYFPHQLLESMSLSTKQIIAAVAFVVTLVIFMLFSIHLVIKTFTSGTGMAAAIQSGFNGIALALAKVQGDTSAGGNDTMTAIKNWLKTVVFNTIMAVLCLSRPVMDRLTRMIKELEDAF